MADEKWFVKVLSAAVKVIRRAEDGSAIQRHVGFDAAGKPVLEPATRTVILEKGKPIPEDAADGELEKLKGLGVIGKKAAVTVVAEQPKPAVEKPQRKPTAARKPTAPAAGTAKRKPAAKKATDTGKLATLTDAKLAKVLVDEKPGVKKLLEAVGGDKEFAQRLLAAEKQTAPEPRSSLVAGLEKVIAGGAN